MPTCTDCGVMLVYDDCLNTYIERGNMKNVNVGHCLECGKTYRWTEIYKFDRIEDVELLELYED